MGCVLGRQVADGRRGASGPHRSRRTTDHQSRVDGVNGDRDKKQVTSAEKQGVRQDVDSLSIERRRPAPGLCQRNEQGWPSWLLEVAGEVIQGWTPRRANTFEKLAKVCHVFMIVFSLFVSILYL